MTGSDPAEAGGQAPLDEFTDHRRCTETTVSTEIRCPHPSIPGLNVCHAHADTEDMARLVTNLLGVEGSPVKR